MRNDIREIAYPHGDLPKHFGLAYDAWAPTEDTGTDAGKVPVEQGSNTNFRSGWLAALENLEIDPDYERAYEIWKKGLQASFSEMKRIEITSRLLVGHGNSSATEVGLTVHHTWGVPVIPGSALKGLCAHYAAATYGRDQHDEPTKFSGVKWGHNPRRIVAAPGEYYRALFGAPDVDNDASAGLVTFHDALYVPDSARDNKPFAVDVLTVHQRSYYGQDDTINSGERRWPNDYDRPNPVAFISVRPHTEFLIAISGEGGWPKVALSLVIEAISAWGIGGKTSAGYGVTRAKI